MPEGASAGLALLATAFDCVWASTWMDQSHAEIGSRLGIPEAWPYIVFRRSGSSSGETAKLIDVQRFVGRRPAAWIDDDLHADAYQWAARRDESGTSTLLLQPEVNVGITPRHVDTLLSWARRLDSDVTSAIEVRSTAPWPAGSLWNFAVHPFLFRGVPARSMEGLLQGLKCRDPARQARIMQLAGSDAKRAGAGFNWREHQDLYWAGTEVDRHGPAYQHLLDEAYEALFAQSAEARDALSATGDARLDHSEGSNDPHQTVLTINEFCSRLQRMRDRYRPETSEGSGTAGGVQP